MTEPLEWALREAQKRYQDGEFTPYPLREEEDRDILVRGVALALAAARRRGIEEEREGWLDCAIFDALMEGPVFRTWNRSALGTQLRRALADKEPT